MTRPPRAAGRTAGAPGLQHDVVFEDAQLKSA